MPAHRAHAGAATAAARLHDPAQGPAGITGLAQVNGLRGETKTLEKMRERVRYDLEYLSHWSPWIDLRIVIRTFGVLLRDPRAY